MTKQRRSRARVLAPAALQMLKTKIRQRENDENGGIKYSFEKLGELTGLDPETVRKVLHSQGVDKTTLDRCFTSFGLELTEADHRPAAQLAPRPIDPGFIGREAAIADLDELVSRNTKIIVIQARGGVGKTTLAQKYLQQEFETCLEFRIAKETKDVASVEGMIEEKLRQLGEEPGREFWVSLDRLKRKLQVERIGVLIDNLEPALDAAGKFIEPHRRYVELLRVLSDPAVQSVTLITSRERLHEAAVSVQHYLLSSLDVSAWEQYFLSRNVSLPSTPEHDGENGLAALHHAYGGNAKAMEILCGSVLEDYGGDIAAYWQANQDDLFIERDLEDLVVSQFDRLQQLDPDAYNLLCRMGCYRYQDVPTVPIEGLFCLMGDIPSNRHRRVIKSLQDRSLIDQKNGEFWLHSAIRERAKERLRKVGDWDRANQEAALFWRCRWGDVTTSRDALEGFEAFHHYVEIKEFDDASEILVGPLSGNNNDIETENLGFACWRLGLSKQIESSIGLVKSKVDDPYTLGMFYRMLGYSKNQLGEIQEAIALHGNSKDIAEDYFRGNQFDPQNRYHLKMKDIVYASFFNTGIARMNLWDFKGAKVSFERCLEKGNHAFENSNLVLAKLCLPLAESHISKTSNCYSLAQAAYSEYQRSQGFMTVWGQIYAPLFMGRVCNQFGDFQQALECLTVALNLAEARSYPQAKANVLTQMSEIFRVRESFADAFICQSKAIEIFTRVGAKHDLAEAYFQRACTHQAVQETEDANADFKTAIRLFEKVNAPKQIERVKQAMQKSYVS